MERIQAAIAKARAARDDHDTSLDTTVTGLAPAPSADTTPPAPDARRAAWDALSVITPSPRWLARNRIVAAEGGREATSFDLLRTRTLQQMQSNGWKRLAITSPMPDSGKTTTACNLAMGLGRQRDLRSILLDLDLRDPSVHEFFEHEPRNGIGRVLSGDVDFADQAVRIGSNVAVSMARRPEADPTRLLLAEETAEVLDRIEATYKPDLMIFDLPSVLVNDDTRAFLKNADCALIVIRANATRYGQFDACEREIAEQTNVLGVVLNAYMNTAASSGGEE